MAINNIEEYLIERLLDMDPTLSVRHGSLMFVKVINPLMARLGTDPIAIDVEAFITQRLRDEFPELDVASPGSSLRDIIVSPLVLLMEPLRREIEFLRTQQSLANQSALSEQEMDAILANVFTKRSLGDYARGTARVYFTAPYPAGIDPTITFSTTDGRLFVPEVNTSVSLSEFQRSGSQYYLDIDVRSTTSATDNNISVGELQSVTGLQNVVRVTNLRSFSGGITQETNEEFLERAERSLSERSLNTKRGIETELMNSFSDIVSIDVVGFGESAMQRDILQGEVAFDLTETTGPMSYMTSDWLTHDLLNSGVNKHFPFTNTVILKKPSSGWTAKAEQRIQNAKFLRIADGSGDVYDHRLLGRVRTITEVYKEPLSEDYYVKTSDFEVYPSPANVINTTSPTTLPNATLALKQGLNMEPAQGSEYRMYAEVDGIDVVTGAFLPFTDILETAFASSEVPGSVIKGRDFLVVADEQTLSQNINGAFGYSVTQKLRTYPLTRFFNSAKLGVGRVDSFLLSRDRYLYRGSEEFVFDTSLTYCALNEGPKVIDFGAPKYTSTTTSDAYGGIEIEQGGRSPGVTIEGKMVGSLGIGTVPNPADGELINDAAAGLHEADLILDRSNTPWDERGAQEGQFVSCTLFSDETFGGSLNDTESNLLWQGTGVVSKVGYGDRWRLRVKGLDWTRLEEGYSGFAPAAAATVTVASVGPTDSSTTTTILNPEGQRVFSPHSGREARCELNYMLPIDSTGDGAPDSGVQASVLDRWGGGAVPLEPSSAIDTRSIVVITIEIATYAQPADDFRLAVRDSVTGLVLFCTDTIAQADTGDHVRFVEAVSTAISDSKIQDNNPATSSNVLLDSNSDSNDSNSVTDGASGRIVLRSMPYGNFANGSNWEVLIIEAASYDEYSIPSLTIGSFTNVADRSVGALAAQLIRQTNYQTSVSFPFTANADGDTGDRFRITHTEPGSAGNDGTIYAINPSFTVSTWNGDSLGNINGGFSAGFGPLRQVVGLEAVLPLYDQLLADGYEAMSFTPTIGTSTTHYMSTAHRNLAYQRHALDNVTNVRIIVEFEQDAVEHRIVLDDDSEGALSVNVSLTADSADYPGEDFSGTVVYGSGAISVSVGTDLPELPATTKIYVAYSYYENPYKVSWTLYRGELEVLDASGNASKSYDELAFAPALRTDLKTHNTGTAAYNGTGFLSGIGTAPNNYTKTTSLEHYGNSGREQKAYWIRLGKPFNAYHPSIGASPSSTVGSAEFAHTAFPPSRGNSVWQEQYLSERYDGSTTVAVKLTAPVSEGTMAVDRAADGTVSPSADASEINNIKALSGFLIPVPMGTGIYDVYGAANELTNADILEHQVVQLFEAAPSDFGDTRINISGIPGGVPLPGFTAVDLQIESDKIHIGGLTDIYLKPSSSLSETTSIIKLSPSSPTSEDGDVVLQASDGQVKPAVNESHFFSSELESALTNLYGATPAYAHNLVLEIIEAPSSELVPTFVRIIHSVPGGCKIDGSFPGGLGDGFENLRFRVLRSATTSLVDPLEILQQGEDLSITNNDFNVTFAGGINFTTDPTNVGMYLHIDSDTGSGEYRVVSRNLSSLQLRTVPTETGSGLSYRIYTKQSAGISLPLVRVSEVSLSGDSLGVKVPYAKPIDVVASAFSGLNDDPINEDIMGANGGELLKESVTIDGELVDRCTFNVPGLDFRDYGAIRYDVLVLAELEESLRHWYVDDILEDAFGDYSILVLDRSENITATITETPFTVGKPSIGTASVKLMDPTFFEVGPDSVFCYEDKSTGKKQYLRPSPAETACVFKSYNNSTEVYMSGDDTSILISTGDFFKHGVSAGDTVRVVTKVLMSDEFDGSDGALEHENITAAGKTLAVKVNNTLKTVTFSGPNPLNIESVVNDINQQLGNDLRAEVYSENRDDNGDGDDETYYRVMISSSNDIEIVSRGTIGIIAELRLGSDLDNTPTGDLIGYYKVTDITYVDAGSSSDGQPRTIIKLDTPLPIGAVNAGEIRGVFIEILRNGYQRVLPGELTADANGLYAADIKLTSYEPNTSSGIVPDDGQMVVTGYKSLGYHLSVDNSNYSYSIGEKVNLVCSSVVLHSNALGFEDVYELAAADVTISYDTAPTVSSIQDFVLSPTVRVLCNNPLVRHYFPAYPIMSISYAGGLSTQAVSDSIQGLLSSLYPNLPLEVYALSSRLSRLGVTYLENPQEVGFIIHDADRNISIVRSKNRVALNKQTHLMEDMSRVTINRVG